MPPRAAGGFCDAHWEKVEICFKKKWAQVCCEGIGLLSLTKDSMAMESDQAPQLPPKGSLAKMLEDMPDVRNRVLIEPGYFTQWVNKDAINVKSVKALSLNAKLMETIASRWCRHFPYVKILTIDVARKEAINV